MGRNYGHDHRDKFELMLWGRGRLLYPDWNAQQYEPMEFGWTRNAWAHSTLVVDESNPKGGSSSERHDFNADVKFLATTSREIYPDVTQTRALLLTGDYLLDFFRADSPRERTYDWFVHALGRLGLPGPHGFQPSQDLLRPYHWVDRERKWQTDQTWSADFVQQSGGVLRGMGQYGDEWFKAKVGVRMTMLGEPGTAAFVGEGPFNPVPNLREYGNPEGTLPLAMARRKARSTCFAALHEPFDKRPALVMRRLDQQPTASGVCVAGAGFTDYACVSFAAGQDVTLTDTADAYQSFSLGVCPERPSVRGWSPGFSRLKPGLQPLSESDYGYLRVARGKVIARGAWRSFRVAAPEAAAAGALLLNGREAPYRKLGAYVLFNDAAESPHAGPFRQTAAAAPLALSEESGLPRAAGVTIEESQRHPLFPMWVVRAAPGYEMHIHRKFGFSRTLIDGHGHCCSAASGGAARVFSRCDCRPAARRRPPSPGTTRPRRSAGGVRRWKLQPPVANRLPPVRRSCHPLWLPWETQRGVPCGIQSFFWHASGRLRTAKDQPLAGLPPTLADFTGAR